MNKAVCWCLFVILTFSRVSAGEPVRFVSVTIDDLPVVTRQKTEKARRSITNRLLRHIGRSGAPVTGFVNERKLFRDDGERDSEQIGYLRLWLENGCDLGNHTYSHLSLHDSDFASYSTEILKGEIVTKELLKEYGKKMTYFRHPYLATGLDLETKKQVADFLTENRYTIAPVSIDTSDWAFSAAYDLTLIKGDKKLLDSIGRAYVPYIEAKTEYWERQSIRLFGREIRQILLLHANSINAEYFDDVVRMFKKRGYKFISLNSALEDKAYRNPDTFTKRAGISWLHRWALDLGAEYLVPNEPRVPQFVMDAADLKSE